MVWKFLSAVFAAAILLLSSAGFAAGYDDSALQAKAPVISGISGPTQLKAGESGTWAVKAYDPQNGALKYSITWGDEDPRLMRATSATFTDSPSNSHIYSSAGDYKVTINAINGAGLSAQASSTVNVVGEKECTVMVDCVKGYEPYFSGYDSNGCKAFDCRRVPSCPDTRPVCTNGFEQWSYVDSNGCTVYGCRQNSVPKVDVSIYAEPSEVAQYGSFLVGGKITFVSDSMPSADSVSNQRKFKVVTSFSDGAYLKGKKPSVALAANSESVLDKIISAVTGRQDSKEAPGSRASEGQKQSTAAASDYAQTSTSYTLPAPSSAQATSVVAVANTGSKSSRAQERVDYITLGPGETATVSAYFTADKPGTKFATISVYYTASNCPSNTQMAMPCKESEVLIGQSSTKVKVNEDSTPPAPPQDEAEGQIKLYSGWNMVSVPVDAKVSMQDVAAKCGSSAYAWRLSQNGYVKEDTLVPGFGYWVKGTQDCNYGVSASSYALSVSPLFSGWNLVGAAGSEVKLSEYSGNCQVVSGPWHYSHNSADSASPYEYASSLSPGKAYWIKVASACSLYGNSDEAPPAPPQ